MLVPSSLHSTHTCARQQDQTFVWGKGNSVKSVLNADGKMLMREQQSESFFSNLMFLIHCYFLVFPSSKYSKIVATLKSIIKQIKLLSSDVSS